jgi:hypothetical protein
MSQRITRKDDAFQWALSVTSFTASSLDSGVNLRRVLPIMDILSCKGSPKRGQGRRPFPL